LGIVGLIFREASGPLWAISMPLFGIYFPHRWSLDKRLPWLKWLLIAVVAVPASLDILRDAVAAFDYRAAAALPANPLSEKATFIVESLVISLFFVGISLKYQDPDMAADDRRRLRILYF